MTPATLAASLFADYEEFRLDHLRPSNCKHAIVIPELQEMISRSDGLLKIQELGRSLEGRSINLVTGGQGEKRVLLWSQMHGDEFTATLALMDLFNFLIHRRKEEWVREMLGAVTFSAIPMLNPDGAERAQRYTAVNIDMNRDARAQATPEACLLKECQRKLGPAFGFNLHDQSVSSVGNSSSVTAISLLAPALDERRSTPPVRVRAMRLGAFVARILKQFAEGHIATYDDTFEPRAFGDNMQLWGTSTLLIESGHWPQDSEKLFIRKLNYVVLLSSLWAIGNGSYQDVEMDHYSGLTPNGKRVYDIIIRGARLRDADGWSHPVDLGLLLEAGIGAPAVKFANSRDRRVVLKEIGDLSDFGALETIDGHDRPFASASVTVEKGYPLSEILDLLQI
jgi:hypothetical protein